MGGDSRIPTSVVGDGVLDRNSGRWLGTGHSSSAATGPSSARAAMARASRAGPAARARGRPRAQGPLAHQPNRSGGLALSRRVVDRVRGPALCAAGRSRRAAREHRLPHLSAGQRDRRSSVARQRVSRRCRAPRPDRGDDGGGRAQPAFAGAQSGRGLDAAGAGGDRTAYGGYFGRGTRSVEAPGRGLGRSARASRNSVDRPGRSGFARIPVGVDTCPGGIGAVRQRGHGSEPPEPQHRRRDDAPVGGRKPDCRSRAGHAPRAGSSGTGGEGAVRGRSGLSDLNRISPLTQMRYLARYPQLPGNARFPMLLPANGTGTLRRLRGTMSRGVVHAKTGTLDRVATLAGYLGVRTASWWYRSCSTAGESTTPARPNGSCSACSAPKGSTSVGRSKRTWGEPARRATSRSAGDRPGHRLQPRPIRYRALREARVAAPAPARLQQRRLERLPRIQP